MSAHSTIRITRSRAREHLFSELLTMGDEAMEAALDRLLDHRLYNVRIVGDDEENDDERL